MKNYWAALIVGFILPFGIATAQPGRLGFGQMNEFATTNALSRFDLDFHGGSPKDLVKAIEAVTRKPMNVVIPEDCGELRIAAVSVHTVTVAELFEAMTAASKNSQGNKNGYVATSSYGFHTAGMPGENSIWYFSWEHVQGPETASVCRFYQLAPYFEAGYKVEDITTAIETAWHMLKSSPLPEIKFHKDTKLLIAVGPDEGVAIIDQVLAQLKPPPKLGIPPIPQPASTNNEMGAPRPSRHK